MISDKERLNSIFDAIGASVEASRADIWTALPGIVQSFNPDAVTAIVQPAITGVVTQPDGTNQAVKLPLLLDCPVVFPRGGGCTLTFPVQPGDECLVVFASRCIDAWWQSGGVQVPMEMRMHDLSDGFVLVGPMSQVRKINNISTSETQIRSDDGQAYMAVNPSSHDITLSTTGNISMQATGDITMQAQNINMSANKITMDTPLVEITGQMIQTGAKGSGATTYGGLTNTGGTISSNGIVLETHVHGDVQSGGSNTGTPI